MIDFASPDFLTYRTSGATLGAYPISFGGLWILTDLHDHYHLSDAHWDVDMIVTLRSPGIHPARYALLDAWMPSCLSIWEVHLGYICAWFSYRFGRPVLHVRWQRISCRSIFDLSCIWIPHCGIFPPIIPFLVRCSELLCLPFYDVQSRHSQLDIHGYSV